jgi:hypothetical protein
LGRQLTERELKRFNRVLAGHARDKDRARRKRKLQGQAAPKQKPRQAKAGDVEEEGLASPDDEA